MTAELLLYALKELTTEAELWEHCVAVVRQQVIFLMMEAAIDAFAETHDEQERQEQELGQLIDSIRSILQDQSHLTPKQIAQTLNVDVRRLEETLDAAVARNLLSLDRHYFVEHAPSRANNGETEEPPTD